MTKEKETQKAPVNYVEFRETLLELYSQVYQHIKQVDFLYQHFNDQFKAIRETLELMQKKKQPLRIRYDSIDGVVYAGYRSIDDRRWLRKTDVTLAFLRAIVDQFADDTPTIVTIIDSGTYKITVKEIKD